MYQMSEIVDDYPTVQRRFLSKACNSDKTRKKCCQIYNLVYEDVLIVGFMEKFA